ncbi:hypothetical protein C8A01DRAFT_13999 [Parachaetomium inaequale]|uniref:Uncharacterized protein n=1 Tax=Parachaetomium inaequale TaxID=2588326 RepID=A0AAN6PLZ1_9PEZI|nr:hypothetical protein C8A01DRAFT_13999 [Parachaetomium inaequale]
MAEVLGVVASGIAVTQAAQSLGVIVVSLSRLWREVRDVPETIRQILDDLEVTGDLVGVIEAEFEEAFSESGVSSTPLTKLQCLTIQRCRQAHKDLGDLAEDLRADIAASRRRKRISAKVRVVLKKDTLEAYERRLQNALRFLGFAVQMHLVSAQKRQPDLVAAKVTEALALSRFVQAASSEPSGEEDIDNKDANDQDDKMVPPSSSGWGWRKRSVQRQQKYRYSTRLLGAMPNCCCISTTAADPDQAYRFHVAPPRWLLKKVWDIQISVACTGWNTVFRHYVVVPEDSQVFYEIKDGTLESLMELFDKGLASPFSVDRNGWTLLHYAVMHRLDFVEPLVRMGLDLSREDIMGAPAFFYRIYSASGGKPHGAALHRLLSSEGIYVDWTDGMAARQMLCNGQIFDWFLANVFHDFYQWPLERRLSMLGFAYDSTALDHEVASKIFHHDGRFRLDDLRRQMPSTGETVLEWLVKRYFETWKEWQLFACLDWSWIQMRLVIRDVAALVENGDLSAVSVRTGKTALLDGIIRSLGTKFQWTFRSEAYNSRQHRMWKHTVVQQSVKAWVEDLEAAGRDLEAYGEAERAAYIFHDTLYSEPRSREVLLDFGHENYYRAGCRWSGFTFGPRPKDWSLIWEWDPDVGALAGEFWASIEDPPLAVPGAWVDDDEEYDEDEYDEDEYDEDEDDEDDW